ncbi:hypothetical protein OG369_00170 [Streptomyces sp. NBC_01221]|uniref:hypothetical protein n=1 Tax=Streptomyces sp. NBC_01221 TaxID=2903782 RepID=UPI00225937B1|nr:hypothetical protein [Streptomyces sp. NBC_01221]MCX4784681.1 hypothetical protein [Streptomyces sp. NBC_01221]
MCGANPPARFSGAAARQRAAATRQAVRVTGLRRTRYRDLPATRLGHVFAATALNLIRINRWLTGTPLGGTRTSHLEALMLAA